MQKEVYDVSKLEQTYKVHGNKVSQIETQINKEEVLGVSSRIKEKETIDYTPKEVKEPEKEEKLKVAKKNLKIHSKNTKDNLEQRKDNKKKNQQKKEKNNRETIAKKEVKKYIVEQLLLKEGDETCSSGVGTMVGNIFVGKGYELLQKAFSTIKNSFKQATFGFIKWLTAICFYLVQTIIKCVFLLFGILIGILGPFIIVIPVMIVVGVFLIAGFFISFTQSGEFAVQHIDSYCSEIVTLSEEYDEVVYHPEEAGRYANYDDMLLVYLSKVAVLEEDATLEGDAPFLWIDKNAEEKAMKETVEAMFYYETSEYSKTIQETILVTCTPTPTVTPIPATNTPTPTKVPILITKTPKPTVTTTPKPSRAPILITKSPTATPIPIIATPTSSAIPIRTMRTVVVSNNKIEITNTPTPTNIPSNEWYTTIDVDKTVTVKKIDIYMMSASEYMSTVKNEKVLENYNILKALFETMGYVQYGGRTLCDSYSIEYKAKEEGGEFQLN